jgi:acetyl esterase/lipase
VRYATVAGVPPDRLSLDVYPTARACPAPVVVWVHGGGFVTGDKSRQVADKVRLFDELGYTFVSVNYRLTDPTAPDPVRYPTHADDVATALAWVEENIGRFGGDPGRVALLGHSAGAQIVASVATDERILRRQGLALSDLACVAPLDTEGFDVERLAGAGNPLYLNAFGPDPAVWADASPIRHVAPGQGIPPHLLVERGTAARRRVVREYADALARAGVPVTVVEARGLTHGDVNDRIGAPGDTVMTPPLVEFLAECLADPPRPGGR